MTALPETPPIARFTAALPFWLSIGLIPLAFLCAANGGWWLALMFVSTWYLFTILDYFTGLNTENADPQTPDDQLYWYRLITLLWAPLQVFTIIALLWYTATTDHLSGWEEWLLFCGVGVISGTIGINYAHELMHQKPKVERWMADILLASVLYSHFRSEHLLVHHRYVATPRDPVTARYNENFWKFFPRVLLACWLSAFNAEKAMLARKKRPWTDLSNPFFRYWAMQAAINLQRHSDHHYKPDRRFPLLQTYTDDDAPQLPYGYPLMTMAAMSPMIWRRMMNPRVKAWRAKYYPEIEDWTPYKTATNPLPR